MPFLARVFLVVTAPLLAAVFFAWRQLWQMLHEMFRRDDERDRVIVKLIRNDAHNTRGIRAARDLQDAAGLEQVPVPEPARGQRGHLRVVRGGDAPLRRPL